jgi:hypothetical protein
MPSFKTSSSPSLQTDRRFLSEVDVENIFNIPRRTLQTWRVLGRGPAFRKFGSGVRYDVRAVEAWIEALPQGGNGVPASAIKHIRT